MNIVQRISRKFSSSGGTGEYAESQGYYDRIPIRVGEFTLVQNEKGEVIFETTSQKFCREGPKKTIRISNKTGGWSVGEEQGNMLSQVTPNVNLTKERLSRRRGFWHAVQYMAGRDLSHRERFSNIHQAYEDDAELFSDDAYFEDGNPVTNDPFGEFLR